MTKSDEPWADAQTFDLSLCECGSTVAVSPTNSWDNLVCGACGKPITHIDFPFNSSPDDTGGRPEQVRCGVSAMKEGRDITADDIREKTIEGLRKDYFRVRMRDNLAPVDASIAELEAFALGRSADGRMMTVTIDRAVLAEAVEAIDDLRYRLGQFSAYGEPIGKEGEAMARGERSRDALRKALGL